MKWQKRDRSIRIRIGCHSLDELKIHRKIGQEASLREALSAREEFVAIAGLTAVALAFTLAVAGFFQASLRRSTAFWERRSLGRRLTGGFAVIVFFLWCAIAIAGRWIAYVHAT